MSHRSIQHCLQKRTFSYLQTTEHLHTKCEVISRCLFFSNIAVCTFFCMRCHQHVIQNVTRAATATLLCLCFEALTGSLDFKGPWTKFAVVCHRSIASAGVWTPSGRVVDIYDAVAIKINRIEQTVFHFLVHFQHIHHRLHTSNECECRILYVILETLEHSG